MLVYLLSKLINRAQITNKFTKFSLDSVSNYSTCTHIRVQFALSL